MSDPILATRTVPGANYGRKARGTLNVVGGLHYIKGNPAPYFSLTCHVHQFGFPDREWSGATHDEILKYFPEFAGLASLHLSEMDGTPLHAEADGLFKIAGAMGGLGQRYHAGNSERYFPDGLRKPTAAECREIARQHFRCTEAELDSLIVSLTKTADYKATIAEFTAMLRPRWRAEAAAVIERHGLVIYGDIDAWNARLNSEAVKARFAGILDVIDRVSGDRARHGGHCHG